MAKIKVKVKSQGDPEKKKTLPDVTVTGVRKKPIDLPAVTVTGVRKKPVDLPEVTVKGTRKMPAKEEDFSKKKTLSDEYKAKLWHQDVITGKGSPEKSERAGRIDQGARDFNYSESYYAKKPGAKGKMMVEYSDGTVKRLGEKYTPAKKGALANVEPTSGKYYEGNGKSWLEWYQSKRQGKED
jgi:hypothetical protein